MTYSEFMQGMRLANMRLNRKALSNMAIEDPAAFEALLEQVRSTLGAPQK
jgi:large subunit ribosomal protein L20